MKRFWSEAVAVRGEGGFRVLLDDRPLRIPGGTTLVVPGQPLAEAIAGEWRSAGGGKGGGMSFADTPLTRLAGTAQQRIAPDPAPTIDAIARYGESDLLCYRALAPAALAARQAHAWQPWLDWAARCLRARLLVGQGVVHVAQPAAALASLRRAVAGHDAWGLAGLGVLVPALGSLVLGLAVDAGRLDPAEAAGAALLDELFQAELWGDDPEATARRAGIGAEVALGARFLELARAP